MKSMCVGVLVCAAVAPAFGEGDYRFSNSATTPITVNGALMPVRGVEQFNFAIFFASGATVDAPNQTALFTDPAFQTVHAYATNSLTVAGRLSLRNVVTVDDPQVYPWEPFDFVIRGWSVSAGATWEEALASWNNGVPLTPMSIGSSVVGNDFILLADLAPNAVFGFSSSQVPGFNLVTIPEPSTYALFGLSVVTLWLFRRCSS